jgi:hypothetical protein
VNFVLIIGIHYLLQTFLIIDVVLYSLKKCYNMESNVWIFFNLERVDIKHFRHSVAHFPLILKPPFTVRPGISYNSYSILS